MTNTSIRANPEKYGSIGPVYNGAPLMMTPGMTADPAAEMPPPQAADSGQVAEITISIMQDGSFKVYTESEPADPADDPMDDEQAEQGPDAKTANSIGEALKIVLDLYKQVQEQAGQQTAQDQFSEGYNRARAQPVGGRM